MCKPPTGWWLLLVAVLVLYPLPPAGGQESWEGNAALIRRGEFTSPGLFAASDAFPLNTRIQVTNLRTGQQVEVTVLRRTDGAGPIFLLLSEQAAAQIGLGQSEVAPVRAQLAPGPQLPALEAPNAPAYSEDPDLNPAISVDEARIAAAGTRSEREAPTGPAAEQPEPVPAAPAPADEEPRPVSEKPPPEAAPAAPEEPDSEEPPATPEERRLARLTERLPQKQLFLPPHRPEELAQPIAPVEPEQVAVAEAQPEPAAEEPAPEPAAEEPAPEEPPEAVAVEPAPKESAAEPAPEPTVSGMVAPPVAEQPEEVPVELPGPAPLAEAPEPEAPAAAPATPEPLPEQAALVAPAATSLPRRSYFLQLGAYSTPGLAEKLASQLRDTYEVVVLAADSQGRRFYRVLVGPLNRDESGTLLYQFRARGFKDAFVRYVE